MYAMVRVAGTGIHPSELVVEIDTINGPERFTVDKGSLLHGRVDVGEPVAKSDGVRCIELPAETTSGKWRVWVEERIVSSGELEAAE
jgi:hypothetical protein